LNISDHVERREAQREEERRAAFAPMGHFLNPIHPSKETHE
jgi:hypothetical protein